MSRVLLAVLFCACGRIDAGVEVQVFAQVKSKVATLETARLNVSSARLVPCSDVMAAFAPISTAWAHGAEPHGEPTFEATLDLLSTDRVLITTLKPQPERFCALDVGVSAASSDGLTLLVQANARRYVASSSRVTRLLLSPFTLDSTRRSKNVLVELDSAPLASLDPASNDARTRLLDELLSAASLTDIP